MRISSWSGIIGIFGFLALLFLAGSCHAASVDVDGWTFTADLGDQWQSNPNAKAQNGDMAGLVSRSWEYLEEHLLIPNEANMYNWKGSYFRGVFWLPRAGAVIDPQNLPEILDSRQNDLLANVDILINRVPEEVKGWKTHDILIDLYGQPIGKDDSVKDIEFNGRPALLIEHDWDSDVIKDGKVIMPAHSYGTIEILMAEDTVVSIDVNTRPGSDLRAWDVIDSFTISPK